MTLDEPEPDVGITLHDAETARYAMIGSRLFYSLYHHPNAAELLTTAGSSRGFTDAYTAALQAFVHGKTRP